MSSWKCDCAPTGKKGMGGCNKPAVGKVVDSCRRYIFYCTEHWKGGNL